LESRVERNSSLDEGFRGLHVPVIAPDGFAGAQSRQSRAADWGTLETHGGAFTVTVLLFTSDATRFSSSCIGRHLIPRQAIVSGNPVDGMVPLLNNLDIDTGRH